MITELEKEFFKCFGIERKRNHEVTLEAISGGVRSANLSQEPFYVYPQITDKQYLELVFVYSKVRNLPICCFSILDKLKEFTLQKFIENSEYFDKHQVQEIFKE